MNKDIQEEGIDFKIPFIIFSTILLIEILVVSLIGYGLYKLI